MSGTTVEWSVGGVSKAEDASVPAAAAGFIHPSSLRSRPLLTRFPFNVLTLWQGQFIEVNSCSQKCGLLPTLKENLLLLFSSGGVRYHRFPFWSINQVISQVVAPWLTQREWKFQMKLEPHTTTLNHRLSSFIFFLFSILSLGHRKEFHLCGRESRVGSIPVYRRLNCQLVNASAPAACGGAQFQRRTCSLHCRIQRRGSSWGSRLSACIFK